MDYVVIGIVVFFVCRELNCWYFKMNERINQLDEIERIGMLLRTILLPIKNLSYKNKNLTKVST
jgi:hypothetical protein